MLIAASLGMGAAGIANAAHYQCPSNIGHYQAGDTVELGGQTFECKP